MTITIPMWALYILGGAGVLLVLFFALVGILAVIALWDFKLNW